MVFNLVQLLQLCIIAVMGPRVCSSQRSGGRVSPGNDPNFKIVAHTDRGFLATNRKVVVFGIPIYAFADVPDVKLLHAANVMAQYLDNDADGTPDNSRVMDALKQHRGALFMWKTERERDRAGIEAQDLGADETVPCWHENGYRGRFDASLEEIWHVITHSGYAKAYPGVFGERPGTQLTKAMDIARGGHFTRIPRRYPRDAWYTYDDESCEYECMATEYIYWATSSLLGAQAHRAEEISQEWKLNTHNLVRQKDRAIYRLLTNKIYRFPNELPNGRYLGNGGRGVPNHRRVPDKEANYGAQPPSGSGTESDSRGSSGHHGSSEDN